MAKWQFTRPGRWDYPTLGFTAQTGDVLEADLAPDVWWETVAPSTPATLPPVTTGGIVETADLAILIYDRITNTGRWTSLDELAAEHFNLTVGGPFIADRFITQPIFPGAWITDDTLTALAITASNNACKYSLVTAIPAAYPGTAPIVPAGVTHAHVRTPAEMALGIAAALATGTYRADLTGVSEAGARATTVRLVAGLAASHLANGGTWGGPKGTNPPPDNGGTDIDRAYWQVMSWAGTVAEAAWLIQADLSPAQVAQVAAMIAWEADRAFGWAFPCMNLATGEELYSGDSKAEELSWSTRALMVAVTTLPRHPHAAGWLSKALQLATNALATAADLASSTLVNGSPLASLLRGTNIEADGTLKNHGLTYPDYMTTWAQNQTGIVSLLAAAGLPYPEALVRGAERLYAAFTDVDFDTADGWNAPGGTIYVPSTYTVYYPNGSDHGTTRMMTYANADIAAHRLNLVPGAAVTPATWALRHLQRQVDLQARFTTGQTYLDATEDPSDQREQRVAVVLARILMMLSTVPHATAAGPELMLEQLRTTRTSRPDLPHIVDRFERTDSTTVGGVGGHPDCPWAGDLGAFQIVGGALTFNTPTGTRNIYVGGAGNRNQEVRARIKLSATRSRIGISIRGQSSSRFLHVELHKSTADDAVRLRSKGTPADATLQEATSFGLTLGATYDVRIAAFDREVRVWINGALVLSHTITEAEAEYFTSGATRAGIWGSRGTTSSGDAGDSQILNIGVKPIGALPS